MVLNSFWQHQIDIKMSKFLVEFVIVSTDSRIILSNFVATAVYPHNVQKTTEMVGDGTPYSKSVIVFLAFTLPGFHYLEA